MSTQEPSEQAESEEDILTPQDIAKWFKVDVSWVQAHSNARRRPYIPCFKLGKYLRYRRGDVQRAVDQWLRDHASRIPSKRRRSS